MCGVSCYAYGVMLWQITLLLCLSGLLSPTRQCRVADIVSLRKNQKPIAL